MREPDAGDWKARTQPCAGRMQREARRKQLSRRQRANPLARQRYRIGRVVSSVDTPFERCDVAEVRQRSGMLERVDEFTETGAEPVEVAAVAWMRVAVGPCESA